MVYLQALHVFMVMGQPVDCFNGRCLHDCLRICSHWDNSLGQDLVSLSESNLCMNTYMTVQMMQMKHAHAKCILEDLVLLR